MSASLKRKLADDYNQCPTKRLQRKIFRVHIKRLVTAGVFRYAAYLDTEEGCLTQYLMKKLGPSIRGYQLIPINFKPSEEGTRRLRQSGVNLRMWGETLTPTTLEAMIRACGTQGVYGWVMWFDLCCTIKNKHYNPLTLMGVAKRMLGSSLAMMLVTVNLTPRVKLSPDFVWTRVKNAAFNGQVCPRMKGEYGPPKSRMLFASFQYYNAPVPVKHRELMNLSPGFRRPTTVFRMERNKAAGLGCSKCRYGASGCTACRPATVTPL